MLPTPKTALVLLALALVACGTSKQKRAAVTTKQTDTTEGVVEAPQQTYQATEATKARGANMAALESDADEVSTLLQALPALREDCASGNALACWLFDHDYERLIAALVASSSSVRAIGELCQAGNGVACQAEAHALDHPSGSGGDPVAAISGLLKLCTKDMLDPCVRAASIRIGSGVNHDKLSKARALKFIDSGCEKGIPEACSLKMYLVGALSEEDLKNFDRAPALAVYRRACDTGVGCDKLVSTFGEYEPFGCDSCSPDSMDPRCMECRAENNTHPAVAPKRSREEASRAMAAAKSASNNGLALLDFGCQRGHRKMCDEKQRALRALRRLEERLKQSSG